MPGGGIFVRTPTGTKVYFWSPARAKVLFSREAEVQSPVVIGLIKQFISSFQVELSFATRREYLTEDSSKKSVEQRTDHFERSLKHSRKYEFPIMSQARQVDKVQVNKIDSVLYTYIVKLM